MWIFLSQEKCTKASNDRYETFEWYVDTEFRISNLAVAKYDDFEEPINIEVFVLLTPDVLYGFLEVLPFEFPVYLFLSASGEQKMVGEMKHLIHYAHSSNNCA